MQRKSRQVNHRGSAGYLVLMYVLTHLWLESSIDRKQGVATVEGAPEMRQSVNDTFLKRIGKEKEADQSEVLDEIKAEVARQAESDQTLLAALSAKGVVPVSGSGQGDITLDEQMVVSKVAVTFRLKPVS